MSHTTIIQEIKDRLRKSQKIISKIIFSVLDFFLEFINPKVLNDMNKLDKPSNDSKRLNDLEKLKNNNLKILSQSYILKDLISFFSEIGFTQKDFSIIILEILKDLALEKKISHIMSVNGTLNTILIFIYKKSENLRIHEVSLAFEVLWNCLSRSGRKATNHLLNKQSIQVVHELFILVLSQIYKLEDKFLRNELMILICYLIEDSMSIPELFELNFDQLYKFESVIANKEKRLSNKNFDKFFSHKRSIVEILFFMITCDDHNHSNNNTCEYTTTEFLDTSNEDMQFKLLIYHAIGMIIKNSNTDKHSKIIQELSKQNDFMMCILYYMKLDIQTKFTDPQKREIEISILKLLKSSIMILFDEFLINEGSSTLLKFMIFSSNPKRKILCLEIFLDLSGIESFDKDNKLDETLIDHVVFNVSSQIDLNSIENIGISS